MGYPALVELDDDGERFVPIEDATDVQIRRYAARCEEEARPLLDRAKALRQYLADRGPRPAA